MSAPIIVVPPFNDPHDSADWVHAFCARLAELGAATGTADGAATADVVVGAPSALPPVFSAGLEAKLAQLTKRGTGKANAGIIRSLLGDLTAAGFALTPAPDTSSEKPGQPYVRVHRPANGKLDTAGYLQASFFAFTGALAHVPTAAKSQLTTGKSMTWIDLDAPGAVDVILGSCTAFLHSA
jgi:hypothetical protein